MSACADRPLRRCDSLVSILGEDMLTRDYVLPNVPNAEDYRIDYYLPTSTRPKFIFGIP